MNPRSFEYFRPQTLEDTIRILDNNEGAKVLAGGQSLIALMKLRLVSPESIVDITRLASLAYLKDMNRGGLAIGVLTTHDMIENSTSVRKKYPMLSEAASSIGDQQIRNRGTIGGSICHADPAADYLPVVSALECSMVAVGPSGERKIKADDFFVDYFTTNLRRNEVLCEIQIGPLPSGTGTAYVKLSRRRGDFAIACAAAIISIGGKRICSNAKISLGAMGAVPIRAKHVEEELRGKPLDEENVARASQYASEGTDPVSDIHGSAKYRKEMACVVTRRAVNLASSRIEG